MALLEATIKELYQSTVDAFPTTGKRQHSTNEIVISKLEWVPFIGMKTLRIKGLAQNKGNRHEYNPLIIFKNVVYHSENGYGLVEITDNAGKTYFLEKLGNDQNDVLIRCNCQDFYWRGTHWDKVKKCLSGPDRKKYEAKYNPGSANPTESMMMCKHIIKLSKVLNTSGLLLL